MWQPPNYAASLKNSTGTTDHWVCDGYDLTNYAFGITKIENSTPEVLGDFTSIPQRNGVLSRTNRSYGPGSLSLSMWVLGCEEDGTIPSVSGSRQRAYFERNVTMLIKLLGAQNAPITLNHILPSQALDGTSITKTTKAYSTGSTSMDTMLGRRRAEMVFTFTLLNSFWSDTLQKTTTVTGSTSTLTANIVDMGDAPVDDSIITITGPITSPTVTCPESGVSFTYNGALLAGQTLVVNSDTWSTKIGSTDVTVSMSHVGHARYMYIPPRDVIGASGNFYPTLVMSGSAQTSATSLKVQYYPKYQVA